MRYLHWSSKIISCQARHTSDAGSLLDLSSGLNSSEWYVTRVLMNGSSQSMVSDPGMRKNNPSMRRHSSKGRVGEALGFEDDGVLSLVVLS